MDNNLNFYASDYDVLTQKKRQEIKTSNRYSFISTEKIIDCFENQGFILADTQIANVRKSENQGFQKHLLRFRLKDEQFLYLNKKIADVNEAILINSFNGTSNAFLLVGKNVFACLNGLISGNIFESYKIRHIGFTENKVFLAIQGILKQFKLLDNITQQMKNKILHSDKKRDFNFDACKLYFDNDMFDFNKYNFYSTSKRLNIPLRIEDSQNTLWNQFNICQEKMIKKSDFNWLIKSDFTSVNSKAINSLDRSTKLNRNLFDLAMSYV